MATAAAAPQPVPVWDEAQCTAALAQLERLKAQLDDLRLTIPRVVEPLYSPPTPSTFRALKDNLVTSQDGIKEFRKQWQAKETQQVFEYGRQSLKRNGDMSKSVEVDKYGWVERERKGDKGIEENNELKKDEGDRGERMTQAEISRVVDEWKGKMPKVVVKSEDENKDLTISFVANSIKHRFHVFIAEEGNGSHKLDAECLGTHETQLAITRCVKSRPHANDLKYLLAMVAAYKTVKGTTCAKCENMLDSQAIGTVARRSRDVIDGEGTTEVVWEAFHEGCVD